MGTSFALLASLIVAIGSLATHSEARAFFVFGDSLVDNGNNNYLATTARADSPPYGIDYPTRRPTGRFSNGLNLPDILSWVHNNVKHGLCEQLGAKSPLPYLSPELRGENLLVGANFASAGIGILNDTGIQFLNIIRMYEQLQYFEQYQQRVSKLIGPAQTNQLVNQAVVLITVGGNDFVNNYYLVPYSSRSLQFSLPDYIRYVLSEYEKLLMRLYELGARRVLVTGTGPMGCIPAELAMRSRTGICDPELQRAAGLYNPQLNQMLSALNSQIGADAFIAVNTDHMQNDFISDPRAYGFVTSKVACCGQGPFNGLGLCTSLSNLCPDRSLYAFWDPFHPSERANRLIVKQIMTGSNLYMNPMNLSSIIAMDSWA